MEKSKQTTKEAIIYNVLLFGLSLLLALLMILGAVSALLEFNHRYRVL